MATMLAEAVVPELIYMLEGNFEAIATEVASERNDALTIHKPDVWRAHRVPSFSAARAQCEVYETSGAFPHLPGRDLHNWGNAALSGRGLTTQIEGVVRVTHRQRDGVSDVQMAIRTRRYLTIVVRLMRDYTTLGGVVQYVVPQGFTIHEGQINDEGTLSGFAEIVVNWLCLLHETDANEGSAGAAPPRDLSSLLRTRG